MRYFLTFLVLLLSCCYSNQEAKNNNLKTNDPVQAIDTLKGTVIQSDSIKKYSKRMKRYFTALEPSGVIGKWLLPFSSADRSDMDRIRVISGFGTYRSGVVKGHRHSGIDIIPSEKVEPVFVYPANKGRVCLIRPAEPNKTVIIRHKLNDGSFIYSSYIHLRDIFVSNGEEVDCGTRIGVLYTKPEAEKFGGSYDHLHFEIKKRIDDYCCASWLCMSQEELEEYFKNPLVFLKNNLGNNKELVNDINLNQN